MTDFDTASKNPVSKKPVFVKILLLKWIFGHIDDTPTNPGLWKSTVQDLVIFVNEDEVLMTETASISALNAQSTASVGAWFYDTDNELLYIKPKASFSDVYEGFYVAQVQILYDNFGQDLSDEQYDARITSVPKVSIKTSPIFDGRIGQIGSGSLGIGNADAILNTLILRGYEPDGRVEITAAFETFEGV